MIKLSPFERAQLAESLGMHEQYIYQCLTGRKAMDPAAAVRVEKADNRVRRWDLRQADWHLIWPELIGIEGSPPIPAQQSQQAA